MAAGGDFWEPNKGHEGEPDKWTNKDLREWLGDEPEWKNAPRAKLVKEVTARLDGLYATYNLRYPNVTKRIDFLKLLPWTELNEKGLPSESSAPAFLKRVGRIAGPLERCFNESFSLSEKMGNFGMTLEMGRHPLDDFRQNMVFITKAIDTRDEVNFVLQDVDQTEALTLKVLDTRFLTPGKKLKVGDKVVCHSLHKAAPDLQHLNGAVGTVTAKRPDCQYTLIMDAGEKSGKEVTIAAHNLLRLKKSGAVKGVKPELCPGAVVVLTGLKSKPELNGRLGQVADNVKGDRYGTRLVKTHDAEQQVVAAKADNLVMVETPPPAVLVAYASHNKSTASQEKAMLFMNTQLPQLLPMIQSIRCTRREVLFMKRCVEEAAQKLVPISASAKASLMGKLDPKQWELSVLMPPCPPLSPAEQAAKSLKGKRSCRNCGKPESKEVELKWCSGCSGVCYCSFQCQKADWKRQHKQECGQLKAKADKEAAGGAADPKTAEDAPAAGDSAEASGDGSVMVPLDAPNPMQARHVMHMNLNGHAGISTRSQGGSLPINHYGDKTFIVKVQNPFNPSMIHNPNSDSHFSGALYLYDKARSLTAYVHSDISPEAHAALVRRLRSDGQRGVNNPAGRKVFLRAKREGKHLRVFVEDLPPQRQNW